MIQNRFGFGVTSLLIVIPILIILSTVLQVMSFNLSFANDKKLVEQCDIKESFCITSKVFSILGVVTTLIMIIFMGVLLLCAIDSGMFLKSRKKCLFKSRTCQQFFFKYHNALIILIPLTLIFQIIAFGTEIEDVQENSSVEYQEGFSTYLVSMVLMIFAVFMHPFINRAE